MTQELDPSFILPLQEQLDHHPVYRALKDKSDLSCFMEHHIFSVWDFMSLIKYLQHHIAPTHWPWYPKGHGNVRRLINALVLEEESDEVPPGILEDASCAYLSHFELYCKAMIEVGGNPEPAIRFAQIASRSGIEVALETDFIPAPSREFNQTTFSFIASDEPHRVAAALALGREHVIPVMFRRFLSQSQITSQVAPIFHYYLERHIHLDQTFHAPLSLELLKVLCDGNVNKIEEVKEAAQKAVAARLRFWDGVLVAIKRRKN